MQYFKILLLNGNYPQVKNYSFISKTDEDKGLQNNSTSGSNSPRFPIWFWIYVFTNSQNAIPGRVWASWHLHM